MFASCEVTPKPEKETARPWKVSWIECSFLRPTPSSTQPIAEVTKVRIEEWQPTDGSDDESGSEIWQDPAAYGHRAPHYEKIRPAACIATTEAAHTPCSSRRAAAREGNLDSFDAASTAFLSDLARLGSDVYISRAILQEFPVARMGGMLLRGAWAIFCGQ
eukprot:CAMPEP_0179121048 /NCGR_PEP_ID=MMETSP0796-20121207/57066_1 /TAXON_ID=73915 /ORGANISM="Pyrodinium bahamense, Strain pbaha01" /LENGTH=160 /DNA_ID=CAMNT_0020819621 /DNA_START=49 /DNA_END=532 /DNA_ORIENTATION=-